ncbi:hypothetical protein L5515_001222 [Caenorhabditis briggsae]|uniref:Uncharacterized protein n=1 Tax=Caenorhabditis briggsae TaxID=6238 RepID=A0AAE9DVT6_CAEBR|nr:hypothetical protein L3Y34_015142 [Caenorhabditis briggsae]UMM12457.1 hypothetical protein L5515_001222 [Caenorhabditis briggsae]
MPTFLECPHCQRLYSRHSLAIHEKNCVDSMQKILEQEKLKLMQQNQKRGRSKSGRRKKIRPTEMTAERPRTRSLSRYNHENVDGLRTCFVCGEQYDDQVIEEHKEKCYVDWSQLAKPLTIRFHIHQPKTINPPSIDGTIDVSRENMRAVQSSHNCQIVRCRYCNARIALQHAHGHQCVRFEPTIEFYC